MASGGASIGLEAGRFQKALSGWIPSSAHVNSLIASSGNTVTSRARYLVRNNGYARAAVESFAANVVGTGIKVSSTIDDSAIRADLHRVWADWSWCADAEKLSDWEGLCRRAARELFIAGEVFIRFRPRLARDSLPVPFQLQMLPSEMLDLSKTHAADNGNWIRQGVEVDALNHPVAYWFFRRHPHDFTQAPPTGDVWSRVPASEVLHLIDPLEGAQGRGLSRMAPGIVMAWMLDLYEHAELDRKKMAAFYGMFIVNPNGDPVITTTNDGSPAGQVTSGEAQVLNPGEDIRFGGPADVGPNYDAFVYRSLCKLSSAWGTPYQDLSADMKAANFGSSRTALLQYRRVIRAFQHSVMVYQLCRPVWQRFVETAVLSGAVAIPDYAADPAKWQRAKWAPPRWDWIDPKKDADGERLLVEAGFKAPSDVIDEMGDDPDEVFDRIAADFDRCKSRDLPLPTMWIGQGVIRRTDALPPGTDLTETSPPDQEAVNAQA